MASTYSANLKIELIGTGEQSGTWGSTTNTNLGTALEEAIVGRATATFATDADLTLTLTNTNATQIARAFALRLESSVNLTATRNLIVPAINKPYIINNQTTGGQSIVVKNATGSGVTIPNGKRVAVYNNGTDVLTTIDYFPTLSVGGTTIPTGKTLVDTDSSQTLTNKTVALGSNTVSGTIAQFNTALTDADFATLAGTETLTNKTLTSPSISGATLTDGTANGVLYLNGSKAVSSGSGLVFDGSNLGLGVTPSAWASNYRAFQQAAGGGALVTLTDSVQTHLASNWYYDGADKYYAGGSASRYTQISGQHRWFTAPSGTAGNPISFTQAMTLDASGNLGIGTTSPVARLSVSGGVGNGITYTDGTVINFVGTASGSVAQLGTTSNHFLQLITNGTAKATLDSSGNLGLGTSSPGTKLEVAGRVQAKSSSDVNLAFVLNNTASGGREWQMIGSATGGLDGGGTFNLRDNTAGANRLTVDSSGNLGLGVTPSAWDAGFKILQISPQVAIGTNGQASRGDFSVNWYYNAGDKYIGTGNATQYRQQDGSHKWFTAPSGTAGNPISFTQAMTLDASGNLGIGTTSPGPIKALGDKVAVVQAPSGKNGMVLTNNSQGTGALGLYTVDNSTESGLYSNANGPMLFWTNSTERMRLDSSGNLGLGVTPSAWGASASGFDMNYMAVFSDSAANSGNTTQGLLFDAYYNAGYKYKITNGYAGAYEFSTGIGNHVWKVAGVGTAGNPITFTHAMTLRASGNLGVGTSSPITKLHVASTGNTICRIDSTNGQSPELSLLSNGVYDWRIRGGNALQFVIDATEVARIDNSGNLLVGTASTSPSSGGLAFRPGSISYSLTDHATGTASGNYYAAFTYAGTPIGTITQNGTTSVAYNTSSDYRLKNITGPITNSGDYIDSLNPVEGTWKADGTPFVGLIAHEVQEVSRTQVATGVKGGEQMQAMDYSNSELIANLIAEVKSLRARVAALESR